MKRASVPRAMAEISESLHRQLNMYALAASAAGVGLLALSQSAEAKIVYTPANVQIGNPFSLDLNHDGVVDFLLFHVYGDGGDERALQICQAPASTNSGCGTLNSNAVRIVRAKHRLFAAALRSGSTIQAGDRFRRAIQMPLGGLLGWMESLTEWYGPWVAGGKGVKNRYLGLKFKIKDRVHFGWARLTITTTQNNLTATLTGYAYETVADRAIIAGATKGLDEPDNSAEQPNALLPSAPEPITLGMLALGAPAVSIWRRKE